MRERESRGTGERGEGQRGEESVKENIQRYKVSDDVTVPIKKRFFRNKVA